ncbi:MAG: putative recombinase [Bacilli bacterium]|nr:putative recombinase [Bacilli bacterium]
MAKVLKNVVVVPVKSLELVDGMLQVEKKKVAAYCRVSTDSEEQLNSYEAQMTYYGKLIHEKAEWEYVDVYADEGTTGTNTKHRLEFHRMIKEALAGKTDMIITKSISRFARNTEDCLKYVRQLKNKGVAVYFEKENIYTLDSAGEVLLTILS